MFPNVSTRSVPEKLIKLFAIDAKAELVRYVDSLRISDSDLVRLIFKSEQIGYAHLHAHKEFQPEAARLTKEDFDVFRIGGDTSRLPKTLRKTRNLFAARKHLSAHLFYSAAKWHLFYFSLRDVDSDGSHWQHGSHVHFVNHLWPHYRIDDLQRMLFSGRRTKIGDSVHIRYVETLQSPDSE